MGSKVRLLAGDKKGPVCEVRAGSGYWSQDSAVQVMNLSAAPTHIWIQWPDGKTTTSELPKGATEVEINARGGVTLRASGQ